MIKVYLSYFFIGFITLYNTLFLWGLSAGPANALPYIELLSSLVIFFIATGLLFFYPKIAASIALVAQIALVPAFYYFLSTAKELIQPQFTSIIVLLVIILLSALYFLTFIWNFKIVRNQYIIGDLTKPIKIVLSFLPVALILIWCLLVYLRLH